MISARVHPGAGPNLQLINQCLSRGDCFFSLWPDRCSDWHLEFFLQGNPGRSGADNRSFVNGVLWVLRSGARWSDLPERYGKYKSVHKRLTRWAAAGVWDKVLAALVKDKGNQYPLIDSTIVRAHQQAVTGKGGSKIRLWGVAGDI